MWEPVLQQSPTPKVHVDPLASILHDSRTGHCTTCTRSFTTSSPCEVSMSDGLAKTAKSSRSRAACDSCKCVSASRSAYSVDPRELTCAFVSVHRSTKQRCDGPSVIPCRRCQLYGFACAYSTAPPTSRKTAKVLAASAPSVSTATAPLIGLTQANVGLDAGTNTLCVRLVALPRPEVLVG